MPHLFAHLKQRSSSHVFLLALCVLALLVAQTFGSRAGYLCLCGGEAVPTPVSHCHGPHGKDCATKEAHGIASHEEEETGDRKDHQVVSKELTLRQADGGPQLLHPQVLLAVLPVLDELAESQAAKAPACSSVDFGKSPPLGVVVARTVVLRI